MPLKLWTGTSGQGKTHQMVKEVIRLAMENPQNNYYIIVPEQFGLEMQRKLISMHPDHGYFNIDVLSFHRLAYRVFDECHFTPYDMLEDLGVSMVLRKILTDHEKELLYFKKSAKKAGFIDELKSVLMELICYGVEAEQLQSMVPSLKQHPNLAHKCEEIGKIYHYFQDAIEGRYMVSEQILDLATDLASESALLKEGIFFFDGFTGFTPVQLKFLKALLHERVSLHITVTIDGLPFGRKPSEQEEMFHLSYDTVHALKKLCSEEKEELEEAIQFAKVPSPRHLNSLDLALLERRIFRTAGQEKMLSEEQTIPAEHIHVTECRNQEAEASYITHEIEKLVRQKGYRYRDMAILCADADGYASAFLRQAEILHIPMFQDTKKKMSYYSGIETVRAIFHMAEMDYSYESVFRYLKSGMSGFLLSDVDALENYVLSTGIRGLSMWKKPFHRRLDQLSEAQGAALEAMRQKFIEDTGEVCHILRQKNVDTRAKMTALYETFVKLDYEKNLNELAKEAEEKGDYTRMREYQHLFDLLLELLDKIVSIFGEETMPLHSLTEVVDAGLEAMGLGVEPLSMDQVIFGDLKRTRLSDIKVLFIAGFEDGLIPPVLEDRGLIRDDEKEVLEELGISLSDNLFEKSLEDEFYLYLAFAKPQDELYFTYPQVGKDGKSVRPSNLLGDLKHIFPDLLARRYPEEEKRYYFNVEDSRELLIQKISQYRNHREEALKDKTFVLLLRYWNDILKKSQYLDKIWTEPLQAGQAAPLTAYLTKELYGEELVGSITKLESFASCPYSFFCTYGLNLRKREEYQVHPMDIGNIFHHALEYFSKEVKASEYTWKNMPDEVQAEYIEDSVKAAVDEKLSEVLQSTARNQYKIHMVTRILTRTVEMLRTHLKRSSFEPDQFELSFGRHDKLDASVIELEGGNHMRLEGVVDRVDIVEEDDEVLLKIIDYKSGSKSFEYTDFYYGIDLQLVIYMNAAREIYEKKSGKTVVPAGIYYYSLKDPILAADPGKIPDHLKEFRMEGLTNNDPQVLELLERLEPGQKNLIQAQITMKKDGTPDKKSKVIQTEDFLDMGAYARKKAGEIGNRIYRGEIQAKPYLYKKSSGCDYCPYMSVCGFDPTISSYEYQQLPDMDVQALLEAIRQDGI